MFACSRRYFKLNGKRLLLCVVEFVVVKHFCNNGFPLDIPITILVYHNKSPKSRGFNRAAFEEVFKETPIK